MAPKIKGSINNVAKAKAHAAAKANKKEAEEEKKMSLLQQCLSKIKKEKLDKHNWPKFWVEMKHWEKSENTRNVIVARIESYLNTPIVDKFGTLKEEAIKFLVSRYHDGKIWQHQPIAITDKLIIFITNLTLNRELVPVRSKILAPLEKFIGSTQRGKNSKGLQINSMESLWVQWTTLIMSIFLTICGWPSNINLDMMEEIDGVTNHAKNYSWANYLADLVNTNCEKCQE